MVLLMTFPRYGGTKETAAMARTRQTKPLSQLAKTLNHEAGPVTYQVMMNSRSKYLPKKGMEPR